MMPESTRVSHQYERQQANHGHAHASRPKFPHFKILRGDDDLTPRNQRCPSLAGVWVDSGRTCVDDGKANNMPENSSDLA
jgi:hypothetical protein